MITRVGGLLLIIGSLLAAFLAILALRGAPVGIGGNEVHGQFVLAATALLAAGTAAVAFGGAAPFGTRTIRVAAVVTSAGLLLTAVTPLGGASTGLAIAMAGILITAIGFVALGAALVRSPGASRWIGAGMLAGMIFAIVGTIGPRDIWPVALAAILLVIASIAALGILGIRAVTLLVITILVAGCTGTASVPPGNPPSAAVTPGAPTQATPFQPTPSGVASSPPASPAAAPPAHEITSELIAQVLIYPDVWVGLRPWPSISVYADGRVIGLDGLRWLTPVGVDAVHTAFLDTGLFSASRVIPPRPTPDTGYGSGYTTYTMTVLVGSQPVRVTTTNDAPSTEGQRLLQAAERLSHPETWLPSSAWLSGWESSRPYDPDRWLLQVAWSQTDGESGAAASPDIAAVDWPFGPLERFGAPDPRWGDGVTARCAVVPDAEVQRLLASLRALGVDAPEPTYYFDLQLGWAAGHGTISLGLEPALPDDRATCPGPQ